jgi:hypothetical protein
VTPDVTAKVARMLDALSAVDRVTNVVERTTEHVTFALAEDHPQMFLTTRGIPAASGSTLRARKASVKSPRDRQHEAEGQLKV